MDRPYICWYCKHFTVEKGCEHFGHNIPSLITTGRFDHKTPIKNEKILFEIKPEIKDLDKDLKRYVEISLRGFISDKKKAMKITKEILKSGIDF